MAARSCARLLLMLAAVVLPAQSRAWGQAPVLGAPIPAEVPPPPPGPAPFPPPPGTLPPPPPAGPPSPLVPGPTPFLPPAPAGVPVTPPPDAGIFAPPSPGLCFFFGTEVQILKPQITNHVLGTATFPGGASTTVAVPEAALPWTAATRFEFGKFLPDNLGFFALSYRFLVTSGDGSATDPDGRPGDLRSRLAFNVLDFDYGLAGQPIAPHWDGMLRVGIRMGQAYFDTQLTDAALSERTTNWFLGAGPHVRYDLQRRISALPGLALFGGADFAVLVGQVRQHYYETLFTPLGEDNANGTLRGTQTVPLLDLQAGLRYTPPSFQALHFAAGYQFEEWFYLGKLPGTNSSGRLTLNGAFVNVRFDF